LGQGYIFGKPEMHLLPNEYIVIPDLMQQKKAEQDVMNTIKMLT
jgi:hypothetical protein